MWVRVCVCVQIVPLYILLWLLIIIITITYKLILYKRKDEKLVGAVCPWQI